MVATASKTIASAATAEALSATTLRVNWVTIQAKLTNSGTIGIRAPLVSSPDGYFIVNPGDSIVLWSTASLNLAIDLAKVFIKASVDGEGVNVTFVE